MANTTLKSLRRAPAVAAPARSRTPGGEHHPDASSSVETIFQGEMFSAEHDEISFQPQTANAKERTVDVVWYGGQTVPRYDSDTDTDYMLCLNMAGCHMERLNSGAPVFDNHMSGTDFRSFIAGQAGTKAQRGSVAKAWPEGNKGMATLQFGVEGESADTDQLWSGIESGRIRNLSFGTYIYAKQPKMDAGGQNQLMAKHPSGKQAPIFEATDWEPFEISPCTVPADFSTQFLTAIEAGRRRAPSPQQETAMAEEVKTVPAGGGARDNQVTLDAARAEGASLERQRVSEITALGSSFKLEKLAGTLITSGASKEDAAARLNTAKQIHAAGMRHLQHGITQQFLDGLVEGETTLDAARGKILDELAKAGGRNMAGQPFATHSEVAITRDAADTQGQQMAAALLLRYDPKFFKADAVERQAAREYTGMSLLEMGRDFLEARGTRTRGLDKMRLAEMLLQSQHMGRHFELFAGGAESTGDFPAILANVANKTLRQAYQAYPQTFKAFCRQVTAPDFKPINRVQLSDAPALAQLNEKGEYHRANLTDSNISYQLVTFGEIVALTRKVIINDDTSAFTRVPALLGVAAARMESDKVWGIVTSNPSAIYTGDTTSTALFILSGHNNYAASGAALAVAGLETARANFRLQKGPQGTYLNLTPRYLIVPAALESTALQLLFPQQSLAVTAVTAGIPNWVPNLTLIVEPRLDASSSTRWYLAADPSDIDTIEYCFLEGQEGVYFETRQGFDVDGIEMKARMDFAAAAIDYRGLASYSS
jgi:hypothetical protein